MESLIRFVDRHWQELTSWPAIACYTVLGLLLAWQFMRPRQRGNQR